MYCYENNDIYFCFSVLLFQFTLFKPLNLALYLFIYIPPNTLYNYYEVGKIYLPTLTNYKKVNIILYI